MIKLSFLQVEWGVLNKTNIKSGYDFILFVPTKYSTESGPAA